MWNPEIEEFLLLALAGGLLSWALMYFAEKVVTP